MQAVAELEAHRALASSHLPPPHTLSTAMICTEATLLWQNMARWDTQLPLTALRELSLGPQPNCHLTLSIILAHFVPKKQKPAAQQPSPGTQTTACGQGGQWGRRSSAQRGWKGVQHIAAWAAQKLHCSLSAGAGKAPVANAAAAPTWHALTSSSTPKAGCCGSQSHRASATQIQIGEKGEGRGKERKRYQDAKH